MGENQRAPNPPEFAQPRLSRVKRRSSPARGYKFGCVCSYMAGHEDAGVMTGHIGTNTPKFVPPRWGRPPFDPTQTGLCKFGWVWSSLRETTQINKIPPKIPGQSREKFVYVFLFVFFLCFFSLPSREFPEARGSLTPSQRPTKIVSDLAQESVRSRLRNSTLETVFRPLPVLAFLHRRIF